MSIRKISVSLLAVSFLFSSSASALSPLPAVSSFSDIDSDHENYEAVDYLRGEGIVEGYADGTFQTDTSINRAEFLKIMMESSTFLQAKLENGIEGEDCYPDVEDDWYAKYVCSATELGIVKGYPDGKFRPERVINFAEASKIVANGMNLKQDEEGEKWYEKFVVALESENAVPKSIVSFDGDVTRGEMAEMIWRIRENPEYVKSTNYIGIKRRERAAKADGALINFESCVDLTAYLKENSQPDYEMDYVMMESTGVDGASVPTSAPTAGVAMKSDEPLAISDDFSTTNVQVEGVDEADIVKTDGSYIYVLSGNTVRVVKALPPSRLMEMDKVTFGDADNFSPTDMYVDGDRLVVMGTFYGAIQPFVEGSAVSVGDGISVGDGVVYPNYSPNYYSALTVVYIFDVSDGANAKELRKVTFEGNYSSSRKIGDVVYVVMNNRDNFYSIMDEKVPSLETLVPLYGEDMVQPVVDGCTDVKVIPGVESNQYLILAAIPVDDPNAEVDKEVVIGSTGTVYASTENLYVAEHDFASWWGRIDSGEKTKIHKFELDSDGGQVVYIGSGSVPGTILNQFSMDEYKGDFRIATTKGSLWDGTSDNNLYILDEKLQPAGKIEGIAPGEKIYSVRFMGERAYMVTFKKVDPFFVIDVADPNNPRILGKLKIPGYSDYLHPFDKDHIIGVGKDAAAPSEEEAGSRDIDFAWYQGMKLAMFDVTDVENPVELHKVVIGDRGTDSELLHNHKALYFDKERGLMAFPVSLAEVPEDVKNDPNASASTYGDFVYQGAYVYDVSLENGFELRGKITHYDEGEVAAKSGYYWGGGSRDVMRILRIDDFLYTVSRGMVKASDIDDLGELNTVELEGVEDTVWGDIGI
ncbi:beta-propeller domain-containing protein [Candidatus Peregrinibacteria bacterium]|nr:beta-propeller domain-containing protein [Candidatus Peregrinibacteria bacterium]